MAEGAKISLRFRAIGKFLWLQLKA